MKRHPSLIPLSREHHRQLLLARLLRDDAPAFKGLPTDKKGKLAFAVKEYRDHFLYHFDKEKSLADTLHDVVSPELREYFDAQQSYRTEIREAFDRINSSQLNNVGVLLEEAIRHEERVLFQAIQSEINLDELILNF